MKRLHAISLYAIGAALGISADYFIQALATSRHKSIHGWMTWMILKNKKLRLPCQLSRLALRQISLRFAWIVCRTLAAQEKQRRVNFIRRRLFQTCQSNTTTISTGTDK